VGQSGHQELRHGRAGRRWASSVSIRAGVRLRFSGVGAQGACLECRRSCYGRKTSGAGPVGGGVSFNLPMFGAGRQGPLCRVTTARTPSGIFRLPWTACGVKNGAVNGNGLPVVVADTYFAGPQRCWRACLVDADGLVGRCHFGASLLAGVLARSAGLLRGDSLEQLAWGAFKQRNELDHWRRCSLGSRARCSISPSKSCIRTPINRRLTIGLSRTERGHDQWRSSAVQEQHGWRCRPFLQSPRNF